MVDRLLDGRYKILQVLGVGGFSETYFAQDTRSPGSPTCVIKLLRPNTNNPNSLQILQRLFQRGAETLERLGNHNQIPRLLAHFEEDQAFYLVQEYIKGNLLSTEFIPEKPYTEAQTIQLLRDVLPALAFVHEQCAIHQDIKPDHLIRRQEDGKLVLVDFSAVKKIWNCSAAQNQVAGTIIGTPGYMAAEQAYGKPRPSSDIYALGMVAVQAITGITPMSLQEDSQTGETVWHQYAKASPELVAIIDKMIRYDFRDRFQSAKDVLAALDRWTAPASTSNLNDVQLVAEEENAPAYPKQASYGQVFMPPEQRDATPWREYLDPTPITLDVPAVLKREIVTSRQEPALTKAATAATWIGLGVLAVFTIGYGLVNFIPEGQGSLSTVMQSSSTPKPDLVEAVNNRGGALQPQGQLAQALKDYEQALQIKPNLAKVLNSTVPQTQGKPVEVAKDNSQAISSPKLADAFYRRGLALQTQGKFTEAVKAYNRAISLNPDDMDAFYNRGLALQSQGKFVEAVKDYNRAISLNPEDVDALYNRGLALQSQGKFSKAIKDYNRAILLKPNLADALYNRGLALQAQGKLSKAAKDYDRATKIKPNLAQSLYNYNLPLKAQGKPVEAAKEDDQATQINSGNGSALDKSRGHFK
jgi:tetratricopeptide (TPR) repeat protein